MGVQIKEVPYWKTHPIYVTTANCSSFTLHLSCRIGW